MTAAEIAAFQPQIDAAGLGSYIVEGKKGKMYLYPRAQPMKKACVACAAAERDCVEPLGRRSGATSCAHCSLAKIGCVGAERRPAPGPARRSAPTGGAAPGSVVQAKPKPPVPEFVVPSVVKPPAIGSMRKRPLPFPNKPKDQGDDLASLVDGLINENKAIRGLVGDFLFAQLNEYQRFLLAMERLERQCEDHHDKWEGRQAEASAAVARREADRREREKREREREERERDEREREEEENEIAESKTAKGKGKKKD